MRQAFGVAREGGDRQQWSVEHSHSSRTSLAHNTCFEFFCFYMARHSIFAVCVPDRVRAGIAQLPDPNKLTKSGANKRSTLSSQFIPSPLASSEYASLGQRVRQVTAGDIFIDGVGKSIFAQVSSI